MKVKFPTNPINGQLYTFIDYNNYCPSKGYFCSTHVYTGDRWVKMRTREYKFIDEAPEEYAKVWESLNEGHKQSLIAQSAFYNLETPYQIKNFWSTRQLGRTPKEKFQAITNRMKPIK